MSDFSFSSYPFHFSPQFLWLHGKCRCILFLNFLFSIVLKLLNPLPTLKKLSSHLFSFIFTELMKLGRQFIRHFATKCEWWVALFHCFFLTSKFIWLVKLFMSYKLYFLVMVLLKLVLRKMLNFVTAFKKGSKWKLFILFLIVFFCFYNSNKIK